MFQIKLMLVFHFKNITTQNIIIAATYNVTVNRVLRPQKPGTGKNRKGFKRDKIISTN